MASSQSPTNTSPPTTPPKKIELVAQCLCKSHTFTTRVPSPNLNPNPGPHSPNSSSSPLPLEAIYCHCTSCRRNTGALYGVTAVWPGFGSLSEQEVESLTAGLRRYQRYDWLEVLFCGTCSSPLLYRAMFPAGGKKGVVEYGVFTGVLRGFEVDDGDDGDDGGGSGSGQRSSRGKAVTKGLVRPGHHLFVGDTVDGGATCWLRGWNGDGGGDGGEVTKARRWMGHRTRSEEIDVDKDWPDIGALLAADKKLEEGQGKEVSIKCHCGGVDLVYRAAEAQKEYDEEIASNEEIPWFVDPKNGKLLGSLDGCDSCTIWSGVDIFTWTFVLLKHMSFPGGGEGFPCNSIKLQEAVEAKEKGVSSSDPRLGTLALYRSSPDVQRYSCSRCSACVFYAWDNRKGMVDVAPGLLHSPDGARAESIISWSWCGEVASREDMLNSWRAGLADAAQKEAEEWRVRRRYHDHWRRSQKEVDE